MARLRELKAEKESQRKAMEAQRLKNLKKARRALEKKRATR